MTQRLRYDLTIDRAIAHFLKVCRNEKDARDGTIDYYSAYLGRFSRWCSRDTDPENPDWQAVTKVADLDDMMIDDYVAWLRTVTGRGGVQLGPQTRKHAIVVLKRFTKMCHAKGWLVDDPAVQLKLPMIDEAPPEGWSTDETLEILKAGRYIAKSPLTATRNMALIGVMAELGLRRAECASLRRESLDMEARRLVPPKQKNRRIEPLKFSEGLCVLLDDYLIHRGDDDGALWVSRKREPLGVSGINQMLKEATRSAGLDKPGKSCHAFRHGLAIEARRNGADHQDLRIMLRHKSDAMVKRYLAIDERDREQLVKRYSPLNGFQDNEKCRPRRKIAA